jgi:hypothetical protein
VASRGQPGPAAGVRTGDGGGRRTGPWGHGGCGEGAGRPGHGSSLIATAEHLHSPA